MNIAKAGIRVAAPCAAAVFPLLALAQGKGLIPCEGPDCNFGHFVQLINNVMGFLLMIAIPAAAVLFSWAGFKYLTSAGDASKVKAARGVIMNVFVGLSIALAAYLIVNLLTNFFLGQEAGDVLDDSQGRINVIYEIA
jgi:hypothetical protein